MNIPPVSKSSLFKKLFAVTFLAAALPIGLSWMYFILRGSDSFEGGKELSVLYYGLSMLVFVCAGLGAYFFTRHITRPITSFIASATEIARGNFSERVEVQSKDEIGKLARIFNYMVTELRRLDEMNLNKIINERDKTETILKNIADGVIVTDAKKRILMTNYVAESWFSLEDQDFEGRPLSAAVENESLLKFINRIVADKNNSIDNMEIALPSSERGKERVLQANAARVYDREKNVLSAVVTVLRDITREKEIDRMKTELVSMVAHELRSPLTCISGFSELLLDDSVTREQSEEYASIILKESNRLNDLINKFLDISKIEAGKSQIKKTPVDIKMLVEKVIDFNTQLAERKRISVELDAPDEVSSLELDRDMMEQAMLNLFSNAVKYSPEESRVTIRVREEENGIEVDVEDTGYGISEKSLPHIFDKFYRVTDNEEIRDTMGSGLGLPLVKEIIEIHEGTIKVQSELGKGSTFSISLPKNDSVVSQPATDGILG